MIYNNVRHECNLYNFFFAPRGNRRMMELGRKISQIPLPPGYNSLLISTALRIFV